MKYLTLLLTFGLLTGCSSTPISQATGSIVPTSSVYAPNLINNQDNPNKGKVTIFRDAGYYYSACSFQITLNGQPAFSMRQGEYMSLSLDPGEYILGANMGKGLCPNSQFTQEIKVKRGGNLEYRISFNANGQIMFTRQK